jgi:hypothetical protein
MKKENIASGDDISCIETMIAQLLLTIVDSPSNLVGTAMRLV